MIRPGTRPEARRAPSALHHALASAFRVDTDALTPLPALRSTFGCTVVLAVSLATVGDGGAAAATVGALLAAVPSLAPASKRPLGTMVATTCGMALSAFVGSTTASSTWAHFMVLAVFAFGGGMLVSLGETGSVVGTQAAMAIIVFGRFAAPPSGAAKLAAEMAAGAMFQILLVVVTSWPTVLRTQRAAVAGAYRQLAALALGGTEQSTAPAGAALDTAEATLASPGLVSRADVSVLRSLVDEGRRMRVELAGLEALRLQLARVDPAERDALTATVERVLVQSAYVLQATADAVVDHREVATRALDVALAELSELGDDAEAPVAGALSDHLEALAGQLRAAATLAGTAQSAITGRSAERQPAGGGAGLTRRLGAQLAMLQANLSLRSTACRHAIRLTLAVELGEVIAHQSAFQRGYWIPLTAALVLRPDFGSTFSRGFGRLVGTVVGVGLLGLVVAGGHLTGAPVVAVIAVLALGASTAFRASYAAYSAFLTGFVLLLLNLATPTAHSTLTTAADRVVDTVVGGAIALVAYAAWPTWTTKAAQAALARLIDGERAYLDAVLDVVSGRAPLREGEMRSMARSLRLARTNCEAVIARSLVEPEAHRIDSSLASGLLAGARRLSLTTHLLRTSLLPAEDLSLPEVGALRDALDAGLVAIGTALVAGEPPTLPPLRRIHTELADTLGSRRDAALLLVESDEIVDAVDTLGALLGARVARPESRPTDPTAGARSGVVDVDEHERRAGGR